MGTGAQDELPSGARTAAVVAGTLVVLLAAGTAVLRPFADGSVDRASQLLRALLGALGALAVGLVVVVTVRRLGVTWRTGLSGGLAGATLALVAFTTVAVGATTGIATVEVHPNVHRPAQTTSVEQATPPPPPPAQPEAIDLDARAVQFPDWLTAILAIVAAIIAALTLAFGVRSIRIPTVRLLGRLFHGQSAPTTVEQPVAIDLDAAAHSFDESAAVIGDDGDPRRAIIAAYAHLLERLAQAGCARRAAEAPEEHLRRSLHELAVPHAAMQLVVGKFLVARFSRHDVTETDREEVRQALRSAGAELRQAIELRMGPLMTVQA